jgi:large-conductance mechanosensitive channel
MAANDTSSKSTDDKNAAAQTPQPLSQKSDAQLKREAKARLKHLDPATAHDLMNEVLGKQVTNSLSGFVDFLREHAIVGLAVGFVLATQIQAVVKQLIASFIDPLFQLLLAGNKTLSQRTFTLHFNGHSAQFGWGAVVYALIDFIFVAVTIYAIIRIFNLDKLDKKKS